MTITTQAQVLKAVREFANILMATPQYQNFDLARQELQQDVIARQAIEDFQRKQQYLQMIQTWGVESPDDQLVRDVLRRLGCRLIYRKDIPAGVGALEAERRLSALGIQNNKGEAPPDGINDPGWAARFGGKANQP